MTVFSYRAARTDGVLEVGVLDVASREEASAALATRGLFPLEIAADGGGIRRRARMPVAELGLGLRGLAELLEAGLPVGRALTLLPELAPAAWRSMLASMYAAVREGRSLSRAMEDCGLDVPPAVIGLVRAGEAGGTLSTSVRRAAEMVEETAAMRAALRAALAYPLVLAAAGLGSIIILIGVVLPRFASIIADLGGALPRSTRIVLEVAALAERFALPVGVAGAIGAFLLWSWARGEVGRRHWHALLLTMPIAGPIRMSAASARIAASLGALLENGVKLPAALGHAGHAGGDAALAERLRMVRDAVASGERLSRSIDRVHALTTTAVQLIRVGEETGQLAPMLSQIARIERVRAERALRGVVRLIEPALILTFGSMVALVAAALLQAIYSVRPS